MIWNSHMTKVQNVLAGYYSKVDDARRLAHEAGLPLGHIVSEGSAVAVWHSILTEAQRHQKVQRIIDLACKEYPKISRVLTFGWSQTKLFNVYLSSLSGFVGRAEEIQRMEAGFSRYRQGRTSFFFVIRGQGGVGKTRLAEFFAISKMDEIEGNVYKVDANYSDIRGSIKLLAEFFELSRHEAIDSQSQRILQQIPPGSILILDNVGEYDGYEFLLGMKSKAFVILTTQSRAVSPFRRMGKHGNDQLHLSELTDSECESFFKERLAEEIQERLSKEDYSLSSVLVILEQKSPLFLNKACQIIERFYFEDDEKDIHSLITKAAVEINKAGTLEERLCKYPFDRISENPIANRLLVACALFTPGKMPLRQVLRTADIPSQERAEPIRLAQRWDFLSQETSEDGSEYLVIHDLFHSYISERFRSKDVETQHEFKRRFVLAWLEFIVHNENVQALWGMYENILNAVRMMCQPEFTDADWLDLRLLGKNHLLGLKMILPPKERRRFLFRLLEDATDLDRVAHINEGLAEGFLRAGKFMQAENFAKQALDSFEALADEESRAFTLRRLGTIYRSTGNYTESVNMYKKALSICEHTGNVLYCADINRQLGQTYLEMGAINAAYDALVEAKSILEGLLEDHRTVPGVRNSLAYTLNTLGNIQLRLGRFEDARKNIEQAKMIHEDEVGPVHFYTAYDLRYLAKAELSLGRADEAIEHLNESLRINRRFFGDSPNVALVYLTMAEAYLKLNRITDAQEAAQQAMDMYMREVGGKSKFVAYAYRILAEVYLQGRQIREAERFYEEAHKILERKLSTTPHMTEVRLLGGKISLYNRNVTEALSTFWQVRSEFIRFGMPAKVKEVDEFLLSALLQEGVEEWDNSVESYKTYLESFPDSLHNKLGRKLIQSLEDEIRIDEIDAPTILDVLCGTGFVSRQMAEQNFPNVSATGIDGSKLMIEECLKWKDSQSGRDYRFYHIPSQCREFIDSKFRYVTLHMGIFQIDLRARHFLFQKLLPCLEDECTIFLTTYSADFRFPAYFERDMHGINQDNPFKGVLFERFNNIGYDVGNFESSIAPVFTKEDFQNLACFFELYGFQIIPSEKKQLDILCVERSWKDRVAFTRIPVISKKVFGKLIPDEKWLEIGDLPAYSDVTFGTAIKAKRAETLTRIPSVFSHVKVDFTKGYPIRYAVAAVLRNREGKTLFVQRGKGARDYNDSWSLPSAFADEGMGLLGSFYESLERNLGITQRELSPLVPVSIRFNLRKDKNGDHWIMAMCLFEGRLSGIPELKTDKYQTTRWDDGLAFINTLDSRGMGDCTQSYRDLLRCGEMS